MTMAMPIKALRFLGNALLVLFGLGTLGSFIPGIPALGELGPTLTANFGPWVTIISLIGAVLVFQRWRTNHRRRTLVLAGLAMFAALGTTYIQAQQIATARANGVRIDLGQALLAGSQSDDRLEPVSIIYSKYDGQDLPLDIYHPTGKQGGKPAPVFVYIHGGGWGAQTLKQRQADYRWFSTRGYLVISLEYPLSSDKRHTWNVAEPQLGCALTWVAANAARFGGDPARLALWGESAGGNLVLNLSYQANAGTLKPSCTGALPHVAATVALYPVVDPALMYRPVDAMLGPFGRMMGEHYTGGSPEQFPDRYAAIASATHISAKAPPSLLIVPEADHLVVPDAAYAFVAKARAAGVDTRLIRMPYAEHGFDLRSGSIGNQLVRQAMSQFLETHGLRP
jgi:acetyl esterase